MAWWKYTLIGLGTVAGLGASFTAGYFTGAGKARKQLSSGREHGRIASNQDQARAEN